MHTRAQKYYKGTCVVFSTQKFMYIVHAKSRDEQSYEITLLSRHVCDKEIK